MFWLWKIKKFYEVFKEHFFSFFFLDVKSTIWVNYWLRQEGWSKENNRNTDEKARKRKT